MFLQQSSLVKERKMLNLKKYEMFEDGISGIEDGERSDRSEEVSCLDQCVRRRFR